MVACESEALSVADRFTLTRRAVLFAPLVLAACKNAASLLEFSGATMGTTYNVVAVDHSRSIAKGDAVAAVEAALSEVNAQMSNWDANSEISRFNNTLSADVIEVSPQLADVVAAAQQVRDASVGQFDITLGPLIELWGFGAGNTASEIPDEATIAHALGGSGQGADINVGTRSLQKTDSQTRIYLSGIGKGHGVDRVAQALADLGLTDYMVEIGGDLFTAGRNPDGRPWQIGIEKPDVGLSGVERVANVSNLGMATSGDYRNYFEHEGRHYSHTVDPRTGQSVRSGSDTSYTSGEE